jgi:hypothetical protein
MYICSIKQQQLTTMATFKDINTAGFHLIEESKVFDGSHYHLLIVRFEHNGRLYAYSIHREYQTTTHNLGSYIQCASRTQWEADNGFASTRKVKNYQDVSKFEDAVKRIQKMYDAYHNNN